MHKWLLFLSSLVMINCGTSSDWEKLIETTSNTLAEQQEVLIAEYKLGQHDRFDWDQEKGTLVFSNDGKPTVVAKIQFVGSISTKSNTWLWSWANPSVLHDIKDQMHKVQAYGEAHNFDALVKAKWRADEVDGWEMTAIAGFLLGAQGGYRTKDGDGFTYMVITDIHWVK